MGKDHMNHADRKKIRCVRTKEVFQIEASECGAACLSMILQYYHCYVSMEQLRYECGISRDGCNAADLLRAASIFGLEGYGYSKSLEEMRTFPVPCILHWNFNHFVVLEGIRGNKVYLNDPALGRRVVTWSELDQAFTGIVLYFKETGKMQHQEKKGNLSFLLKDRLSGQKMTMLYLILTGLLLVFPGLALPLLTQIYIDDVVMNGKVNWLFRVLAGLGSIYLFQMLFNWIRADVLAKLRYKLYMLTGYRLLYKLFRLPMQFFDQRYAGELSQRIENNSEVNDFLTGGLSEAVLNGFEAMFYLFLMLLYSPVLTGIGMAGILLNIILSALLVKPLENLVMKQRQDQNRLVGALCAGLTVFSTIKANGAENDYAKDILGYYAETTESEQRTGRTQQILNAFPESVSNMFQIVILMAGVSLVIRGECTAGILTAFCQLLAAFTAPVNELIGFTQRIQMMKANMTSVADIENATEDSGFQQEDKEELPVALTGSIEVRNVTYSYGPQLKAVVNQLSFKASPGSRIGITGISGCGKSTIVRLISGLLYPQKGEILYDGIPLQQLSKAVITGNIAVVGQSSFFFSGSIRENLTFGNEECQEQQIVESLKDAEAYGMVNALPDGLEYHLEEGAKNLSGGQRQKLQIARALMKDPAILIMDEATSAMDPVTEAEIMENISRKNCTCIIVAHRLSAIRNCDMILVLEHGRIVQTGTHDMLMEEAGTYRKLLKE